MKRSAFPVALVLILCLLLLVIGFLRYRIQMAEPVPAAGSDIAETTMNPTEAPSAQPTATPAATPTATPSAAPTEEPTPTPTEEPTPEPTGEPTPEPTPEPTAEPTAEPSPTPTPVPTATPVPAPTATPLYPTFEPVSVSPSPVPDTLKTAKGSFRSNTGVALNLIVYYSVSNGTLTADVYVESYKLETIQRYNDLSITIGGTTKYFSPNAINIPTNVRTETLLGTMQGSVTSGTDVWVEANWNFGGYIGGKPIGMITAAATVSIP